MNKKKQGWTLKKTQGDKIYLYTWEYDREASEKKREEMRQEMANGNAKGYTKKDLGTKASRYKWTSKGLYDLSKPSPKLQAFLLQNMDQIPAIEAKAAELRAKGPRKQKQLQEA